jgi:hypothetical protein
MPQAAGVQCEFQRPNQQDADFWPPCSRHSRQGHAVQLSWAEVNTGYQEFDPLRGFQSVQSRRRVRKRSNVILPGPQYRCDFVSEVRFVVNDHYARWHRDTLSPQQRDRRLLCQTIIAAVSICDQKRKARATVQLSRSNRMCRHPRSCRARTQARGWLAALLRCTLESCRTRRSCSVDTRSNSWRTLKSFASRQRQRTSGASSARRGHNRRAGARPRGGRGASSLLASDPAAPARSS